MKRIKNRRGFGLIELTLALAIAAIVGFVVIKAYSNAKTEKDALQVINEANLIQSAVQGIYGNRYGYAGLSTEDIVNSLPKSMIDNEGLGDGVLIKLSGGGKAMVMPYSTDPTNNNGAADTWALTLAMLSDQLCMKLAAADFGKMIRYTVVNNDSMHVGKLPISDAMRLCNQQNGQLGNMIQLTIK